MQVHCCVHKSPQYAWTYMIWGALLDQPWVWKRFRERISNFMSLVQGADRRWWASCQFICSLLRVSWPRFELSTLQGQLPVLVTGRTDPGVLTGGCQLRHSVYFCCSVEYQDVQVRSRSAWPFGWGVCRRLVSRWAQGCQWRQGQTLEIVSNCKWINRQVVTFRKGNAIGRKAHVCNLISIGSVLQSSNLTCLLPSWLSVAFLK
jgi:hypothetical protein